jgi:hypothetical protein
MMATTALPLTIEGAIAEARSLLTDAASDTLPGEFSKHASARTVYTLIDAVTKLADAVALLAAEVERGKRET